MNVSVIIPAAGHGQRAGFKKNKLLVPFNGETTLSRTVNVFNNLERINRIIISASAEDFDEISLLFSSEKFSKIKVVLGGETRTQSVMNALNEVTDEIVLIHDGARPFITADVIERAINSVISFGSGVVAVPNRDTLCFSDGETAESYIGKAGIYSIQTPQGFLTEQIVRAYGLIKNKKYNDDSEVYGEFIDKPHLVLGDFENVKLTYKEDFDLYYPKTKEYRFGVGFDCHRLVENRKLILGGVEIPHEKGLLGHSDADVLTHAVMDGILSALSLRDIGYHFPDNDQRYLNADSMKLLEKVLQMIEAKGFKVESVSATIMAEKPKLIKRIPEITENLAKALGIESEKIGIGATTLEGLGFVGREEGICVHANATLVSL